MNIAAKIIIVIAVFLAGFYFGQHQAIAPATTNDIPADIASVPAEEQPTSLIAANLVIDYGEDRESARFENMMVAASSTVFDLLREMTLSHDIDLDYRDYGGDLGAMVESIGDKANDFSANRYWQYWLNGEYALVGASSQVLEDGDSVEWKYIEGQMGE